MLLYIPHLPVQLINKPVMSWDRTAEFWLGFIEKSAVFNITH